ncbi:MAG: UDP-2,3-diacylglucosamine diphosphatase [Gemmatimonadota bacterium]
MGSIGSADPAGPQAARQATSFRGLVHAVYFLSDVHLGAGPPELDRAKERDLVAFLATLRPGETLYLLGDVFDFWFDFGGPPPARYAALLEALGGAVRRAVRISFMGGNHDYWARAGHRPGWLEREIGLEVAEDPHVVEHQGLRLLLSHGDALGGPIGGYRAVRAVLHQPVAIRLFRLLPSRLGYAIADRTSGFSRDRHDDAITREHARRLREAATRILVEEDVDAVVAGHVHVPERLETPHGLYLNLGDWILHRTYGRLEDGELMLETFTPRK